MTDIFGGERKRERETIEIKKIKGYYFHLSGWLPTHGNASPKAGRGNHVSM